MAIWIQSLSWAIIWSLGQGIAVYALLWLMFKLLPSIQASIKYYLSLTALTVLLISFAITWWQQFHSYVLVDEQPVVLHLQGIGQVQVIAAAASNHPFYALPELIRPFFPWLAICYAIGLVIMLVRLSGGVLQLFMLRSRNIAQAGDALDDLMNVLKQRMHIDRSIQLLISAKAHVPMVIGWLKPVILMPAAIMAQLSTDQVETILLHELAHIKRHDYIVNILQTVVETFLFFNPFVWVISDIIRREREHACDDMVVMHTEEPLSYATALETLATYPGASFFTVAASGQPNYLFHRIKRIMEMKKNSLSYSKTTAAIFIFAAITSAIVWLTPAIADTKNDKEKAVVANTVVTEQQEAMPTGDPEEIRLIAKLMQDHLIDEVNGFIVEKRQDKLYINNQLQSPEVAAKYLQSMKQEEIRVMVYPFKERLRMHPDGDLLQIIAPVSFSSPCVDVKSSKKPGC